MEHFIMPANKVGLVEWLLRTAASKNWIVVLEYAEEKTRKLLARFATEVPLPPRARLRHHADYRLSAFTDIELNNKLLQQIMGQCAVLSVHNTWQMLFLITEAFCEECFSCRASFYKQYGPVLDALELIYAY